MLLRRPDLIYHMDRYLQEHGLTRIEPQDFQHSDLQVIFGLAYTSLEQGEIEPLNYVLNHLADDMMSLADAILEATQNLDAFTKDVLEDVLRALVQLRTQGINQQLDHLRFLQEAAQEQGDLRSKEYQKVQAQYAMLLGRLHRAQNQFTNLSPIH
jgi:ABC-type phosphate transport system auxiliary subunit